MERRPEHQRTTPSVGNGSKLINRPPEVPQSLVEAFGQMASLHVGIRPSSIDPHAIEEFTTIDNGGRRFPAFLRIPVARKPLIPFSEVAVGGKRTYGGGTSPEALRRARQKAKRHAREDQT